MNNTEIQKKTRYIKDDNGDYFDPNSEDNHAKRYLINKIVYTLYNKGGKSYKFVKHNETPKKMGRPKKEYTPEELEKRNRPKRPVGRPKKQKPEEFFPAGNLAKEETKEEEKEEAKKTREEIVEMLRV